MSKCEECKHLSDNGLINSVCLKCVLSKNFKLFEPKKQTNRQRLATASDEELYVLLFELYAGILSQEDDDCLTYIRNWLNRYE